MSPPEAAFGGGSAVRAPDLKLSDYDAYISDIVIQEASKGDETQARQRCQKIEEFPVLRIDDEVKELARQFLARKIIPEKCPEDALHIAVARPMAWMS